MDKLWLEVSPSTSDSDDEIFLPPINLNCDVSKNLNSIITENSKLDDDHRSHLRQPFEDNDIANKTDENLKMENFMPNFLKDYGTDAFLETLWKKYPEIVRAGTVIWKKKIDTETRQAMKKSSKSANKSPSRLLNKRAIVEQERKKLATGDDQSKENQPHNGKLSMVVAEKNQTTHQEENATKKEIPSPPKNLESREKSGTSTRIFSHNNIGKKRPNPMKSIDLVDDKDENPPSPKRQTYQNHENQKGSSKSGSDPLSRRQNVIMFKWNRMIQISDDELQKNNHQSPQHDSPDLSSPISIASSTNADTDVSVSRNIKIKDSDDEEPLASQPVAEKKQWLLRGHYNNEKIQWLLRGWSEKQLEAKLKENHREFHKKKFLKWEQRGMLWYLITRNAIHKARSRQVWKEMRGESYLVHRSVSSLLNQFIRGIRPFVDQINMPLEILDKFRSY